MKNLLCVAAALALAAPASAERYDAAGTIACRVLGHGDFVDCRAKVVRKPAGTATVYISRPDGRRRIVRYKNGEPIWSDAKLRVRFERNRDTLVIRIGKSETYEVPDKLVFGPSL